MSYKRVRHFPRNIVIDRRAEWVLEMTSIASGVSIYRLVQSDCLFYIKQGIKNGVEEWPDVCHLSPRKFGITCYIRYHLLYLQIIDVTWSDSTPVPAHYCTVTDYQCSSRLSSFLDLPGFWPGNRAKKSGLAIKVLIDLNWHLWISWSSWHGFCGCWYFWRFTFHYITKDWTWSHLLTADENLWVGLPVCMCGVASGDSSRFLCIVLLTTEIWVLNDIYCHIL